MNADSIILQEFRENVEAICKGEDPLEDPEYFTRYMGLFDQTGEVLGAKLVFGDPPPTCSNEGCDNQSHSTCHGLCAPCHFKARGLR